MVMRLASRKFFKRLPSTGLFLNLFKVNQGVDFIHLESFRAASAASEMAILEFELRRG